MRRWSILGTFAVVALAGCGSTSDAQKTDGNGPSDFKNDAVLDSKRDPFDFGGASWSDDKLYQDVDEKTLKYHDSDMDFHPTDNSDSEVFVRIAEWVKARNEVVRWCMSQKPQRLDQAIAILDRIIRNVPTATRERFLLGWYLCVRGSGFFDMEDKLRTDVVVMDEQGKELGKDWRLREADRMRRYVERYQRAAVYHLLAYADKAPMDKTPVDLLWKCYWQLLEYENARKWLAAQIELMPDEHPKKKEYLAQKDELDHYIAEMTLKGSDFGKKPRLIGASGPDGAPPPERR